MRILFVGGMYRGYRLAERLIERGENVVGAYVYEEDAHESPKYCDQILAKFTAQSIWCKKTRKLTANYSQDITARLRPDVILCMGWRTLIPANILAGIPRGGIAVHDSLLPQLRGFAPTNWGMILGHDPLGVTLFQLSDEVDAGVVYFQECVRPARRETYASVQEQIAEAAVRTFDHYLDAERNGVLIPQQQRHEDATYACARTPADGEIRWGDSSVAIDQLIRALAPPGPTAFTYHRGAPLAILAAEPVTNPRNYVGRIAGRIVDRDPSSGGVDVLCGDGVLRITQVQPLGSALVPAAAVLPSVRESLGMNHSLEISQLRARLDELELRLAGPLAGAALAEQSIR